MGGDCIKLSNFQICVEVVNGAIMLGRKYHDFHLNNLQGGVGNEMERGTGEAIYT
jgi:hypothetical protein